MKQPADKTNIYFVKFWSVGFVSEKYNLLQENKNKTI